MDGTDPDSELRPACSSPLWLCLHGLFLRADYRTWEQSVLRTTNDLDVPCVRPTSRPTYPGRALCAVNATPHVPRSALCAANTLCPVCNRQHVST